MDLKSFIPDGKTLLSLPPEDLGVVVLRTLNSHDADHARRRGGGRENFSLSNFCLGQARMYSDVSEEETARAIATAFQHLINIGMLAPNAQSNPYGWFVLTDRGKAVKTDADYEHFRKASLYPRGGIHPVIEQESYTEFLRGDYETAVFKAYKAIEVAVRQHANLPPELVGKTVMERAFNESGPLTDASEVKAEQEALMKLFSGAIGRFKNPTSHREFDISDPAEAIEIIQLASFLMRTLDRRVAAKESASS
jgi:uncharacterized protein (TIGR02391 family)